MKINKNILEKAEKIIQQQKEEQDYLFKCIKACICPICGSGVGISYGIWAHNKHMVCTKCDWKEDENE